MSNMLFGLDDLELAIESIDVSAFDNTNSEGELSFEDVLESLTEDEEDITNFDDFEDVSESVFDFTFEIAIEADEGMDTDSGEEKEKKVSKIKAAVSKFWNEKIIKALDWIKEKVGGAIARIGKTKFVVSVKKWALWTKLASIFKRNAEQDANTAHKSLVEILRTPFDKLKEKREEKFKTREEVDKAARAEEWEKFDNLSDTDQKDVSSEEAKGIIGSILAVLNKIISPFKTFGRTVIAWIGKMSESKPIGVIKRGVECVMGIFSRFWSAISGGVVTVLSKLPFRKKADSASESVVDFGQIDEMIGIFS